MKRRVLISAAGTGTAFALFTRLRATWGEDLQLYSADINPACLVTASVLADRHFNLPRAADPFFLTALRTLIEAEIIDTYVPLLNSEISQASSLGSILPKCDLWTSALIALLVKSKRASSQWLSELGVHTPPILNLSEIDKDGQYFAKPDDGLGSYGANRVNGEEALALDPEMYIVQPICTGPEITVDSFFDVDTGLSRAIARERVEVKAGVSTKARVYESDTLSEIANRIGVGLQQKGTICFQVMQMEGEYVVTDLNFRIGAGTAMTVAAGIDIISASFACRWGENFEAFLKSKLPKQGLFITRQYADFVMPSCSS